MHGVVPTGSITQRKSYLQTRSSGLQACVCVLPLTRRWGRWPRGERCRWTGRTQPWSHQLHVLRAAHCRWCWDCFSTGKWSHQSKKKSHILSSLSCHREHQVKTVDMYFDSYQEVQVLSHVHEKPPDHSSQVNNVRWLVHFKHFSCVLQVPEGRIQEQWMSVEACSVLGVST